MKKYNFIIAVLAALMPLSTFADHAHGSVDRLAEVSQRLEYEVRMAPINYYVKSAVSAFTNDVRQLTYCTASNGGGAFVGCHTNCQNFLYRARSSFRSVAQYLHDTNYEFPQVFWAYRETAEALNSIQSNPSPFPGPGPGPGQMVACTAVDSGWEEHAGGHVAYARNIYEAQRRALGECRRFHGRCRIRNCR